MTFNEILDELKELTDDFTKPDGSYRVSDRGDVRKAINILNKYYNTVGSNALDFRNRDLEGTDYLIEFDNLISRESTEDDLQMKENISITEDVDYAIKPTYRSNGVTKKDVEKYAELLGLDYDTALRRWKMIQAPESNYERVLDRLEPIKEDVNKKYYIKLFYNWKKDPDKIEYFDNINDAKAYGYKNAKESAYISKVELGEVDNDDNMHIIDTLTLLSGEEEFNEAIEKHDELNPKLWDGDKLKPEVEAKLREIVQKFDDNLKENDVELDVKDICIIGSNANYNYSPDSDIDLHIIADTSAYPDQEDLAMKVYLAYKSLFNNKYDPMINGIEAEIYVEPDAVQANSNGIYSLNNGWLKAPEQVDVPEIDPEHVQELIEPFEERYNEIINGDPTVEDVDQLIDDIYLQRQQSIAKDGEFSDGNICFKEFRNRGYLQNLRDLKVELENKEMSLNTFGEGVLRTFFNTDEEDLCEDLNLEAGQIYENGPEHTIEILSVNDGNVRYKERSGDDEFEDVEYAPRMASMLSEFDFKLAESKECNEDVTEYPGGLEFDFDDPEKTLSVYLQWEGIIGYDWQIIEAYNDGGYDELAEYLDEEGIYGYTENIRDILEGQPAFCRDMEIEDFKSICRHQYIDPEDANLNESKGCLHEDVNNKFTPEEIEQLSDGPFNHVNENGATFNCYYCGTEDVITKDDILKYGEDVSDYADSPYPPLCKMCSAWESRDYVKNGRTGERTSDVKGVADPDEDDYEEVITSWKNNDNLVKSWAKAGDPIIIVTLYGKEVEVTPDWLRRNNLLESLNEDDNDPKGGNKESLNLNEAKKVGLVSAAKSVLNKLCKKYENESSEDIYNRALEVASRSESPFVKDNLIAKKDAAIEFINKYREATSLDENKNRLVRKFNDIEKARKFAQFLDKDLEPRIDQFDRENDDGSVSNWYEVYYWDPVDFHEDELDESLNENKIINTDVTPEMIKNSSHVLVSPTRKGIDELGTGPDDSFEYERQDDGWHTIVDGEDADLTPLSDDDLYHAISNLNGEGNFEYEFNESFNEDDYDWDKIHAARQFVNNVAAEGNDFYSSDIEEFGNKFGFDFYTADKVMKRIMMGLDYFNFFKKQDPDTRDDMDFGFLDEAKYLGSCDTGKQIKDEKKKGVIKDKKSKFDIKADINEGMPDNAYNDLVKNAPKTCVIEDSNINLPGYGVSYITGYAGNGVNRTDTKYFRTEEKRDEFVKELESEHATGVKTFKIDNFYHTKESLDEKLDDRIKELLAIPEVKEYVDYIINNAEYDKYTGDYDYIDITADTDFEDIAKANNLTDKDLNLLYDYIGDHVYNESLNEDVNSDNKISALAKYLNVDISDIDSGYSDNIFEVSDGSEYFVGTEDEAYDQALDQLKSLFDDMGLDLVGEEWQDEFLNSCMDMTKVEKFIDDEIEYFETQEEDPEMLSYLNSLDTVEDKVNYVKDTLGPDAFKDWAEDFIDFNKASELVIDYDGVAPTLASYDGEEVDLGNNLYAYRIN